MALHTPGASHSTSCKTTPQGSNPEHTDAYKRGSKGEFIHASRAAGSIRGDGVMTRGGREGGNDVPSCYVHRACSAQLYKSTTKELGRLIVPPDAAETNTLQTCCETQNVIFSGLENSDLTLFPSTA
jgi:hypothetical protein